MENKNIYTDADLRVGETISVFGRNFLLWVFFFLFYLLTFCSPDTTATTQPNPFCERCTTFRSFPTSNQPFARQKHPWPEWCVIFFNYFSNTQAIFDPQAEPPYTGYGTPEDSLGSFYNLVPKVPRKPMGRDHLDGKMLRWMAKFKSGSCSAEDEARCRGSSLWTSD